MLKNGSKEFDVRVVVTGGKARQMVVRVSRQQNPMTNLHLGNTRGEVDALQSRLGNSIFQQLLKLCESAAALFPESLCVGVDAMVSPERGPVLIELNAFGDLLPGITWQKQDSYETQVIEMKKRVNNDLS